MTSPGSVVVGYRYDLDGNRTKLLYPDATAVTYSVNKGGQLAALSDWASPARTTGYTYAPDGHLKTITNPNGTTTTSSYDNAARLTQVLNQQGANTLTQHAYTLDAVGNRTAAAETLAQVGGGTATNNVTYTYDKLYRLTGDGTRSYGYDPVGNRTALTQGTTTNYTYDRADRVLTAGATGYTFDATGNTTARGTDAFAYDQANRLKTATVGGTTTTDAYDGDGKRASQTTDGSTTTYVYDANRSLPVMLKDTNRKYVWGAGLAYSVDNAGALSVSHADGLGSVRALTDASGALIGTYLTDPFGVVLSTGGSSTQPFRFTGEQRDATGLYYLRARMYDPGLGRFLSRDTYSGSPASPLSLNRYSYVHNNPVNATDPTGHCMAKVTREDCGEGGSEDLSGSGDNQCTTTLGGLLSFQGVNARCAQPQSGTVVIEPVQVGPGIVVYVPRVVFATPPGGSGGNSDRGFDRILQDDNLFMRWLNRGHPAAQPLAAATAKKVWEKIQQLGMTPRLDPGHVGRKYWQGPHINIEEMNVHIPVDPSFRP